MVDFQAIFNSFFAAVVFVGVYSPLLYIFAKYTHVKNYDWKNVFTVGGIVGGIYFLLSSIPLVIETLSASYWPSLIYSGLTIILGVLIMLYFTKKYLNVGWLKSLELSALVGLTLYLFGFILGVTLWQFV